jgi:hypothetical protein
MEENNEQNESSDIKSSDIEFSNTFAELFNENVRQMKLKSGFIFRVPTDLEREPIVYKGCAEYDPRNRVRTGFVVQDLFKNVFDANQDRGQDLNIHQSTIIGWTEQNGQTFYVNRKDVQFVDSIVRYTDSIFPVLTFGRKDSAIPSNSLDQLKRYYGSVFIALIWIRVKKSVRKRLRVLSADNVNQEIVSVHTHRAELFSYLGEDIVRKHGVKTNTFGRIRRILDIYNTDYAVIGLYAGGPFPLSPERLTWDQWPGVDNDVYSLLRHEIDYQRFSHRIGYIVGKDGLLVVSEKRRSIDLNFSSLLKDYTYVIVDGIANYRIVYAPQESRRSRRTIKTIFNFFSDVIPYSPKIVIIGEGVNVMFICEYSVIEGSHPNYRQSNLYLPEQQIFGPVVIDWYQFQNDLELFPPHFGSHFKRVMHSSEINDCVLINFKTQNRYYLFSMRDSPKYMSSKAEFREFWNVFCLLDGDPNNGHYMYACSVDLVYKINRNSYNLHKQFFMEGALDDSIDERLYPQFVRFNEIFQQILNDWRNAANSQEFADIAIKLLRTPREEFRNPGLYTDTRFVIIRSSFVVLLSEYY